MPHVTDWIADYAAHKVFHQSLKEKSEGNYDKFLTVCVESDGSLQDKPEYRRIVLAFLARSAVKSDPAKAEEVGGLEGLLTTFPSAPAEDKGPTSEYFALELDIRTQAAMTRVLTGAHFDAALGRLFPAKDTVPDGASADDVTKHGMLIERKHKLALYRAIVAGGGAAKKGDAQAKRNADFVKQFRQTHTYADLLKRLLAFLAPMEAALPTPFLALAKQGKIPASMIAHDPSVAAENARVRRDQLVQIFEGAYQGDCRDLILARPPDAPADAGRPADDVAQRVKQLISLSKSLKGKGKDPLDDISKGSPRKGVKRGRQEVDDEEAVGDSDAETQKQTQQAKKPTAASTPRPQLASPVRANNNNNAPGTPRSAAAASPASAQRGLNASGSRARRPWTSQEVDCLRRGVAEKGLGQWSQIRTAYLNVLASRTSVDIKDKWRNMVKSGIA
eukprot:Opistho-2@56924